MIFSTAVVVSVLSLLSCTSALTLNTRQDDCALACPDTDAVGNALSTSSNDDTTLSCSYTEEEGGISCVYDAISGNVIGDGDGCLEDAVEQCLTRRSRQLKQAVARRAMDGARSQKWSRNPARERRGYPSPLPKRDAPYSASDDYSYPKPSSKPSPSPSPSPKPKPSPSPSPKPSPSWNPPQKQPCNYRCPIKDLAKSPLTDEAIRGPSLYCSYLSSGCESCSFCKYSTKTGLLLEDNDDGKCPKNATLARPWDRRYA